MTVAEMARVLGTLRGAPRDAEAAAVAWAQAARSVRATPEQLDAFCTAALESGEYPPYRALTDFCLGRRSPGGPLTGLVFAYDAQDRQWLVPPEDVDERTMFSQEERTRRKRREWAAAPRPCGAPGFRTAGGGW